LSETLFLLCSKEGQDRYGYIT